MKENDKPKKPLTEKVKLFGQTKDKPIINKVAVAPPPPPVNKAEPKKP